MKRNLIIVYGLVLFVLSLVSFPNGAISSLLIALFSLLVIGLIKKFEPNDQDQSSLINIFCISVIVRICFGLIIYSFSLQNFFGGDALTYDALGQRLVEIWQGKNVPNDFLTARATATSGAGWGMSYLVGAIYFITGQSILVAQSFCAVVGAATAPMIYFCAEKIFHNRRVARMSALSIALFPSFIIWSSQLMKDGLIIFLLVCAMTMVLQLQKRFSFVTVAVLIFSLFGIISLRFYIFYMVAVAVAGSFVIGVGGSTKSVGRRIIAVVVVGLSLTYLGVLRNAGNDIEQYANLERIQQSRLDLSTAGSGFGEDLDVSTTEGAIAAIPVGFIYLMLAPFPWQISSLRQAITLPEILLWWALIPLIVWGIWYTIKNRLREAIPILLFTLMLSLAYSVFQGNVGTAYRQRTQIQVFLFIFVAVGWSLIQERREDKKLLRQMERERDFQRRTRANA